MPYISKEARADLQELKDCIQDTPLASKGELNYAISLLLRYYQKYNGSNYQNLSDCIAACTDAAEEFRRLFLNPYEDRKRMENGDIC